jgi:Fe2+ transport system protein FeoA
MNASTSSLSDLSTGETGTIACVDAEPVEARRLADLGFIRGAKVELVRRGRPCIVRTERLSFGLGIDHQRSIILDHVSA